MRNTLWTMILVAAVFVGFMMGYSVPPMIEVGLIGGGDNAAPGVKTEVDENLEEYYRSLSLDGSEGQSQ